MVQAFFFNIEKNILANLRTAKAEIKVAVAWMTNPRLFDALMERLSAGKAVEIVLADDKMNFCNQHINFQKFIDSGGTLRISRYPKLMHHKFCIIDKRLLITGSYNWTNNAEYNNFENVIVATDFSLITSFLQAFEELNAKTEKVALIAAAVLHDYTSEQERQSELEWTLTTEVAHEQEQTTPTPLDAAAVDIPYEIEEAFERANLLYLEAKHEPALRILENILETHDNIPNVYELMAFIKWRQDKFKEQVELAQKAIDLDNQSFGAYNTLGIGYSHLRKIKKSIDNYEVCLINDPDDYSVTRNRALSYRDIAEDPATPANMRIQFNQKAITDLKRAIALADKYESESLDDYRLYFIRGMAKYELFDLGIIILSGAKSDLLKALEVYERTPKGERDVHELREMKAALKDIEKNKK